MKKKLRKVWIPEGAYRASKSEAAKAGMKYQDYLSYKLGREAESEERTIKRRFKSVF